MLKPLSLWSFVMAALGPGCWCVLVHVLSELSLIMREGCEVAFPSCCLALGVKPWELELWSHPVMYETRPGQSSHESVRVEQKSMGFVGHKLTRESLTCDLGYDKYIFVHEPILDIEK